MTQQMCKASSFVFNMFQTPLPLAQLVQLVDPPSCYASSKCAIVGVSDHEEGPMPLWLLGPRPLHPGHRSDSARRLLRTGLKGASHA